MDETNFIPGHAVVLSDNDNHIANPYKDDKRTYCGKRVIAVRGLTDATCPTCRRIKHAFNTWNLGKEDYVYRIGEWRLVVYETSKAHAEGFYLYKIQREEIKGVWRTWDKLERSDIYDDALTQGFISLQFHLEAQELMELGEESGGA